MESHPPEKLYDIANGVHSVVTAISGAMGRFREMCEKFWRILQLKWEHQERYDEWLNTHFKKVAAIPELREKSVKPGEDYVWTRGICSLDDGEKVRIEGWVHWDPPPGEGVPEHFEEELAPEFPFERPLCVKYAWLAAVHDFCLTGGKRILRQELSPVSLPDEALNADGDIIKPDLIIWGNRTLYEHMLGRYPLKTWDTPLLALLEAFLEDVKADLLSVMPCESDQEPPHPDGPEAPNRFWWKGQYHETQPRIWKMINFMWTRDKAPYDSVLKDEDAPWDENEEVNDNMIYVTVSRASTFWLTIGCPLTLRTKDRYILKEHTPLR